MDLSPGAKKLNPALSFGSWPRFAAQENLSWLQSLSNQIWKDLTLYFKLFLILLLVFAVLALCLPQMDLQTPALN